MRTKDALHQSLALFSTEFSANMKPITITSPYSRSSCFSHESSPQTNRSLVEPRGRFMNRHSSDGIGKTTENKPTNINQQHQPSNQPTNQHQTNQPTNKRTNQHLICGVETWKSCFCPVGLQKWNRSPMFVWSYRKKKAKRSALACMKFVHRNDWIAHESQHISITRLQR